MNLPMPSCPANAGLLTLQKRPWIGGKQDPTLRGDPLQQRHSRQETQSQPWMGDCHLREEDQPLVGDIVPFQ